MHQSHLDFIKQRMCGLLSLLLPLENLATDVPQLGKDSVQRIVKSMTLEEKASRLGGNDRPDAPIWDSADGYGRRPGRIAD